MMDCMASPMASNLKLLSDASSESVDATIYRQMIGSETRYLLCCEHIETCSLDGYKACRGTIDLGSSMMRIRRLTWMVMLIQIGQAVPSTGRVLRDVASVWDQV